jgi:hypothetical protein
MKAARPHDRFEENDRREVPLYRRIDRLWGRTAMSNRVAALGIFGAVLGSVIAVGCSGSSSGTDGGAPDSGPSEDTALPAGIACTSPFAATGDVVATFTGQDLAVAAQLLGSENATLLYNCATSAVGSEGSEESTLAYSSGNNGSTFFAANLSVSVISGLDCPTLDAGSVFDVSTSCVIVQGGVNLDGQGVGFANTATPSMASGTFTLSAFSVEDGGTVAGTFNNAQFVTTSATASGGGQVVLNGSYSAVNGP